MLRIPGFSTRAFPGVVHAGWMNEWVDLQDIKLVVSFCYDLKDRFIDL